MFLFYISISYRPGDVVITFTGVLYHRVSKWVASSESGIVGVTPGRMAFTHFSPGPSLKILQDKPRGWFWMTMGGKRSSIFDKLSKNIKTKKTYRKGRFY